MLDDRALVEGSLRGDATAFAELVRKYQAPLLASAYHLLGHAEDAQDLAQETFIEAYRRLPALREVEKLRGWLFTILRHKCLHFLREHRHTDISFEQVEDTITTPGPTLDGQDVWQALQRLPLPDREILAARYLQELSFAEIAVALGISVNSAEVRCSRARTRLRGVIRELEEEETRALMRRAMGTLPACLIGEAFLHQVLQEVTPMMHAPALTATSSLQSATSLATKKSLALHLLAQATGWKTVATVAIAITVIGAAKFVAPRLAKPGMTTASVAVTAQAASPVSVSPPASATTSLPRPVHPAILLAAAPDISELPTALAGTVVDAETGAPIPEAHIRLYHGKKIDTRSLAATLSTDKNGQFSYHTPPEQMTLLITEPPPGYLKMKEAEAVRVELQNGKTVSVKLKLRKGLTVMVTDQQGKPIAGAIFTLLLAPADVNKSSTLLHFTTDRYGLFEVSGQPAGKGTLILVADWKPDDWERIVPLDIDVPGKEQVVVKLNRMVWHTVSGRVVDTKNHPLAGVTATFLVAKSQQLPGDPPAYRKK